MSSFNESLFYKTLQDFFINNNKETFLQLLAEFYNRTDGIITEQNIHSELIKELRELYLKLNENGLDEEIIKNKIDSFLERNEKIESLVNNTNNIISQLEQKVNKSYVDGLINGLEVESYKGKKIVMLGDSIMDICGIPEKIGELNGATVINGGFQGCLLSYNNNTLNSQSKEFSGYAIVKAITENNFSTQTTAITNDSSLDMYSSHINNLKNLDFNTVDIITIAYGTNDFGFNIEAGTYYDEEKTTISGSIKNIIQMLQTTYPNIEIIFLTPIFRRDKNINSTNNKLEDYVNVIKETCSNNAIKIVDLFSCSGINEYNYSTLLNPNDKLHPNTAGALVVANAIIKYLGKGYVGQTNKKYEKPNSIIIDNENFQYHHPNNRSIVENNNRYLTHAQAPYNSTNGSIKYKDLVLCDNYFYINKLDSVIVEFDYIEKSTVGSRVDVALYEVGKTGSDTTVAKFNTLSLSENEIHCSLKVCLGSNFTPGNYRLYVCIKAMDDNTDVKIRNINIEKIPYDYKTLCGQKELTVPNTTTVYYTESIIYRNANGDSIYNDWGGSIIPIVTANAEDREIIVTINTFYNHFDITIQRKDTSNLEQKTYKVNYIVSLPI